jgi:DNA repair ATPase RecN
MASLDFAYNQVLTNTANTLTSPFSYSTPSTQHPSFLESINDMFERTKAERNEKLLDLVKPNTEELDKCSVDAVNIVRDFQNKKERLDLIKQKIAALKTDQEQIDNYWTDISNKHDKIWFLLTKYTKENEETQHLCSEFEHYKNVMLEKTDLCNKKINNSLETFNTECYKLEQNINEMRHLIITGVKEILPDDKVQQNLCPICFERPVETCLVPCGHTVCKLCSSNMRSSSCMTCRAIIRERITMFFSV